MCILIYNDDDTYKTQIYPSKTNIMKKSSKKQNGASSMEKNDEPHWSQRLLDSLAQRDNALVEQLASINRNLRVVVENQLSHNLEMADLVKKVIRKQDKIIACSLPPREGRETLHSQAPFYTNDSNKELRVNTMQRSELVTYHTFSEHSKTITPEPPLKYQSHFQPPTTAIPAHQPVPQFIPVPLQAPLVKKPKNQSLKIPNRLAVVGFQEKQIIVKFEDYVNTPPENDVLDFQSAKQAISSWSADLYHTLSKETFKAYEGKHLTENEAKVFFNFNLGLNFANLGQYFYRNHRWLWDERREELVKHFQDGSDRALEYLMVKYPQKRKGFVTQEIKNAIPVIDQSQDPTFDVLANTKIFFKHSPQRKGYAKTVKIFMNALIMECRKNIQQFRRSMKDVFTVGKGKGESSEVKNLIGMKFKEDTPLFSKKEIEAEGLTIRTPELLRVIIKWIAELEKKVRGLANGSKLHNSYPTKNDSDMPYEYLNKFQKADLKAFMFEKEPFLKRAEQEIRLRVRSIQTEFPQFLTKYSKIFATVKRTEVKTGLLSLVLSQAAANFASNYLLMLIDLLQTASSKMKRFDGEVQMQTTDKQGNTFVQTVIFRDLQLVSFTVSDLLRCKCSGTLQQVKQIYRNLLGNPLFTVYRVKNRFDTCNRDFLINVRMNGSPILCEIQLAILDEDGNEKEKYLSGFCHFLYELQRASHGPVTEAVLLNSHFTDFKPYFGEELAKIPISYKPLPEHKIQVKIDEEGRLSVPGYRKRGNNFTYVCCNCTELRIAYQTHLQSFDSAQSLLDNDQISPVPPTTKYIVCGMCILHGLNPPQQSLYLLGRSYSSCFQIITNLSEPLPSLIIAIQKEIPARKLKFFQKATHLNTPWYVSVFYEICPDKKRLDVKTLKKNYFLFKLKEQVDFEVIETSNFFKNVVEHGNVEGKYLDLGNLPSKYEGDTARDKKIMYSVPYVNEEILKKSEIENLEIILVKNAPWCFVVNAHHTDEQLSKLTRKGRELKDVQVKVLQKNKIWRVEASDLDDSSFCLFTQPLDKVYEIRLAHNCISNINFVKCPSLKILDLSDNEVLHLKLDQNDFPYIETIQLTQNKVQKVEVHSQTLTKLFLACNSIAQLDQNLLKIPNLEELQICNNILTVLDLSKLELSRLNQLDASENSISVVGLPENMTDLEYLDFHKNRIDSLNLEKIRLPSLKYLDLQNNNLQQIYLPEQLPSLQTFFLSRNKLQKATFGHCSFQSLKLLSLGYNNLSSVLLPSDLPSLQKLKVYFNQLSSIDMTTLHVPNLKVFDAEGNRVTSLRLNPISTQLQSICLNRNFLREMDFTNIDLSNLEELSFSSNNVSKVQFSEETSLKKLKTVEASNNPFFKTIPSNIPLTLQSQPTPSLTTVNLGIESPQSLTLWLLRSLSPTERSQIYKSVLVSPFDPSQVESHLDTSWKAKDLPQFQLLPILQVLLALGRTPPQYTSSIEQLLKK